jgi:hypothetical protein
MLFKKTEELLNNLLNLNRSEKYRKETGWEEYVYLFHKKRIATDFCTS